MLRNKANWLESAITPGPLGRGILVLAPVVLAAVWTGQATWLQAGMVTISTFIGMERGGAAPLGVLLHGIAILGGFLLLLWALAWPPVFVLLCAGLAAGSILVTARGAKLRSLGNFTFIPAVYLACEISENLSPGPAIARGLQFLPFAACAVLPTLLLAADLHLRGREASEGWLRHFRSILRHVDLGRAPPWAESVVAVTLAVAVAAALVEWRHLGNGQWVIWSAASVVTGDYASAGIKLRNRGIGALIGVPAGILIGQVLPRDIFAYDLAVLASVLTLVAFNSYIAGFAARSFFIAIAFMLAGYAADVAAERVVNVLIGGVIGYGFVLGVHAMRERRPGQLKRAKPRAVR
jgi:hypothetical protein